MLAELKKIVENNKPKSFGMIIKANKTIKLFIDNFKNQHDIIDSGEAIFCLYHDKFPEICECGNKKRFCNFTRGYWATCGSKICTNQLRSQNGKLYFKEHPEIMKNANAKTQKTLLTKYGTNNCSSIPWVKNKKKETCVNNHGHEYYAQSPHGKEKLKKSCLEKYGVENPQQNKEVQEKTKQTCLARYQVEYAAQTDTTKTKSRQTNLKKYKVEFSSQKHISLESLNILNNKNLFEALLHNNTVKIASNELGINPSTIYDYIKLHNITYSNPNFSSYEQDISNWLCERSISFEPNTRNIIPPFELDLYIPDHNLAIEFNGLYWHSEMGGKDKKYHLNKTKMCEEKGIRLLHIFEDEWLSKKELCLDLLSRFINLSNNSLMARKCVLREVSTKDSKIFLNDNHLQGFASASVYLGLYFNEKLVQLMSFRHSRYNENIEWENIRCCNKIGFKIVGGVQKLWKYFVDKYQPTSVVSYCDRRWFLGVTYKKLGFSMIKINPPQYNYTDHQIRWHRSLFTKTKCIKKALTLNIVTEQELYQMTEKQIAMEVLGLDRIWDCGQTVWTWIR